MADEPEFITRALDMTSLKALAHPLRVRLLDTLSVYGPATASGLGERLGESSGATSYHLRQLEKHGFVVEDTSRGSGRERWWRRAPGAINLDVLDADAGAAERAAGDLVMSEWQRNRDALLRDYVTRADELPRRWQRAGTLSTYNLQLNAAQLAELVGELEAVLMRWSPRLREQSGPGVRPVQVQLNAFPVVDGAEQPGGPETVDDDKN